MTKYSLRARTGNQSEFEGIALFSHTVPHSAMYECARTVFFDGDDVQAVDCIDLETGEILFEIDVMAVSNSVDDDVDESFYDPYLGCDVFE